MALKLLTLCISVYFSILRMSVIFRHGHRKGSYCLYINIFIETLPIQIFISHKKHHVQCKVTLQSMCCLYNII